MGIGRTFSASFLILRKNLAALLVGGLITAIAYAAASFVPPAVFGTLEIDPSATQPLATGSSARETILGVLIQVFIAVPLAAGLVAIAVGYATSGHPGEIGEVFSGYSRIGALIVYQIIAYVAFLIAAIVSMILTFAAAILFAFIPGGFVVVLIVALAPIVYLLVNWLYVVPILFDKQCGVMEALTESRRQVRRNGFWPTFIIIFLVGLVGLAMMALTLGLGLIVALPWMAAAIVAMYMQASDRERQLDALLAGQPISPAGWTGAPASAWSVGAGGAPARGTGLPPGILPPMGPRSYDPQAGDPRPHATDPVPGAASPGPGAASAPVPDGAPPRPERPAPAQGWDQMPAAAGAGDAQTPATTPVATPAPGPAATPGPGQTAKQGSEPMATPEPPTPPTPPDPA